ncbi:MAG: ABC transporter substrate-binding protein [Lachnospiraceae bacterium]|nr:ABC transporter substrate-binding protein [Lachnospiraceae bacterium]
MAGCGAAQPVSGGEMGTADKKAWRTESKKESGQVADRSWMKIKQTGSLSLRYATQFSVDFYEKGYALVTVAESGVYLVVPEGGEVWEGIPQEVTIIKKPLDRIYLVATSAMDLFHTIDGLEFLRFSGTKAEDWYLKEAREAMEAGTLLYAGKYSAPDYERIVSERCDLAVESTMIYHTPEVKEKLEKLGIPVFVERSSYEPHPLGRMEWIKLYGVLLDKAEKAEAAFDSQLAALEAVLEAEPAGKTAAFFYIASNGSVNVRTSEDYIARMIGLAGGSYIPQEAVGESSVVSMQMEEFFAEAKEADYLIYSSAVGGKLESLDEFLAKNPLLSQFKAVKEGHVFCTGENLFQETMGIGGAILELNRIFTEKDPKLSFFNRLE